MYVLGAVFAYFHMVSLVKTIGAESEMKNYQNLYLICYIAGWFGARSFSVINDEKIFTISKFFVRLFDFGPMTFYGGFIASILAGYLYARVKKLKVADLGDVGIIAGFLALVVGRIGCFLNGDDYGVIIESPSWHWLGVSFPNLGDVEAQRLRYPVQLFEAGLVLIGVLIFTSRLNELRKAYFPGVVATLFVAYYCVVRFVVEYFRGDPRGSIGILSTSQFISLLVFVGVIAALFKYRKVLFCNR